MPEPFLGEIEFYAFGTVPTNWMVCAGQLLPISQYQALFSVIGTTYGGNGQTTFALPNLQGREPVGQGAGHSLSPYALGQVGGEEGVALSLKQIPAHFHAVVAVAPPPATPVASPAGNLLSTATENGAIPMYGAGTPLAPMAAGTVANGGGGQTHENRMPYLALNACIAVVGLYPPRG